MFLDEIQSCPNARTAIKFLVEDGRFDYIESGSLLGLNYGEVSSYPVGFEYRVDMYPLDFEEFLWAKGVGEEVIEQMKATLRSRKPLNAFMHEQLSKYYREYLIVGGMPEVVTTYIGDADFSKTLKVQRSIVDSYRDDIAKYAGTEKARAKVFFDAIPAELSKQKKRFIIANIEQRASAQKYENAAQWLIDAGVAYFSYNTHDLLLPFEQSIQSVPAGYGTAMQHVARTDPMASAERCDRYQRGSTDGELRGRGAGEERLCAALLRQEE